MSSVGDKDIKQEATAFLASIMDADDQDLGKAATKVEWQRSPIPTSQIISIAAQLKAIQETPAHTTQVKLCARRLHAIMTSQPLPDYDNDSDAEVRDSICELLGEVDVGCTKQHLLGHTPAIPTKREFHHHDQSSQPLTKKPATYTPGLSVRPSTVTAEFTTTIGHNRPDEGGEAKEEDEEDEEDTGVVEEKQAKRKARKLQPELLMQLPQVAGQSLPYEDNADTKEIKSITKLAKTKAYQKFSLVEGLPKCNKACPVLDLLEAGGYPQSKIAHIRKMTGKYFTDKYKDTRQDANSILHVLSDTLSLVAATRTQTEVDDATLKGIERNVHIVAMLQSQKLVSYGETIMEKIVEHLRLPDVGALRKVTGITDELTDAQQQQVLSQIKLMVEMNTVIRASNSAQGGNDGATGAQDDLPRTTVQTADQARTKTVSSRSSSERRIHQRPPKTAKDKNYVQLSAKIADSARNAPTQPERSETGDKDSTWTSIRGYGTITVHQSDPSTASGPQCLPHWATPLRMAILDTFQKAIKVWLHWALDRLTASDPGQNAQAPPMASPVPMPPTNAPTTEVQGDDNNSARMVTDDHGTGGHDNNDAREDTGSGNGDGRASSRRSNVQEQQGMAEAIPQHPSCSMDEAGRSELAVTTVTTTSTTTTTINKRAGTDTNVQLCDPANAGASLRTGNGHAQPRTGAETSIPSMVHPAETKQQATASDSKLRTTRPGGTASKGKPSYTAPKSITVLHTVECQDQHFQQEQEQTTTTPTAWLELLQQRERQLGPTIQRSYNRPSTKLLQSHLLHSGRRESESFTRHENVGSQQDRARPKVQVRQHNNTPRAHQTWGLLHEVGPTQGIPPSPRTPAVPQANEKHGGAHQPGHCQAQAQQGRDQATPQAQAQELPSGKAPAKNTGTGLHRFFTHTQENADTSNSGAQENGHAHVPGDGRPAASRIRHPDGNATGLRNNLLPGTHPQLHIQRQQGSLQPTAKDRVVRSSVLLSDISHDAPSSKSDKDSEHSNDANQDAQAGEWHDDLQDNGKSLRSNHGDQGSSGCNTNHEHSHQAPEGSHGRSKHAPERYTHPNFQRSNQHPGESDRATWRVGMQLPRAGAQRIDHMERQVPPLRVPDGDDIHGRMRMASGLQHTKHQQPPRDQHETPVHGGGSHQTHHPLGARWSDGRGTQHGTPAQPDGRMLRPVRGCVSSTAIPAEHGWQDPSPNGQNAIPTTGTQATASCATSVPHSGQNKSWRQAIQAASGPIGVQIGTEDIQMVHGQMGQAQHRPLCGEMEQPASILCYDEYGRPLGYRIQRPHHGPYPLHGEQGSGMDVPTTTPQDTLRTSAPSGAPATGSYLDHAAMASNIPIGGNQVNGGYTTPNRGQQQQPAASHWLPGPQHHHGPTPIIELEDVADYDWRSYVRKYQTRRGVSQDLAENPSMVYKSSQDRCGGDHLNVPWSLVCTHYQEKFGAGTHTTTDVILCNIAAKSATSEGRARTLLSGSRTVMQKAWGPHVPLLQYDSQLQKQVIQTGRIVAPTTPRYEHAVDLLPVWHTIIEARIKNEGGWKAGPGNAHSITTYTPINHNSYMTLRNCSLFLGRAVTINRSDCFTKWDPRDSRYFRCFNEEGERISTGKLSSDIQATIPNGYIELQYLNPKDPRKQGLYSLTTTVRPIRIDKIMDISKPHLHNAQCCAHLCFVRSLYFLIVIMEGLNLLDKIEKGSFWCNDKQTNEHGKPLVLKSTSLSNIIKHMCERAGIKVNTNETPGVEETSNVLAGHFLRGHSASLAYDLALAGASWSTEEGVNRARHTLQTFFKNYYRRTVARLLIAFQRKLDEGKDLRFEEALVL